MASNFLRLTLIGRDQSASSSVDALTRRIRTAGATISGIGDKVSGAGQKLTLGVTAPLAGVAALGVRTEADFSRTMAQVGVATDLPQRKLKGLTDYALEMGAKTTFSAGEAATAMLNLAKGGFTQADIKGGALAATMNLASAGGLDLSEAADDVVSTMGTFNLQAKDAGQITSALAGAANASSADVSDLTQALSAGGAAARATKQPLADTAGMLALLADNGIKGSDAGTSMKTFLTNLIPQTDASKDAMNKLGLSFVNADGSIKKLPQVAEILKAKFSGLSDAQRITAEKTIFGTDAFRAAEALYQSGPQKLAKYTQAAKDQTSAQKMAAAQMSGTAGAMEAMSGSVETAALTIGQTLAPYVIKVSNKIAELANWFSSLDGETKKSIVAFALVAAAIGPTLFVTGKLISGVGSTVTAFANARTAATNFGLGLRSASAAGSATTGLAGTIGGAVRKVGTALGSGIGAAARWGASLAASAGRAAAGVAVSTGQVIASLARQGAAWAASAARTAASVAATALARGVQLAAAAATGIATAAQWLLNAALTANPIGIVVVAIAALVAGLIWFFSQTKVGQQIWAGFVGFLRSAWAGFTSWISTALNAVIGFFGKFGPQILAIVAPFIGLPLMIISHWKEITAWFGRLPGVIGGLLSGAGKWLVDTGSKILDGLLAGAKTGLDAVGHWALGIDTAVIGWLSSAGRWLVDTGSKLLAGLLDGAKTGLVALGRWELGIGTAVIGWLAGAASWLVNTGLSLLRGLATGATRGFTAVTSFLGGIRNKVVGALAAAASWLISVGGHVVDGLVSGIRNAASGVVRAISGVVTGAIDAAKRLLGIASPSKVFRQIGAFVGAGLIQGLQGSGDQVAATMRSLRDKVVSAFNGLADQREAVQKRLRKLDQELGNVDETKKAGKARAAQLRRMISDERAVLAGVNKAAIVGKSALLTQLDGETKKLAKLATRRDKLAKDLKTAQGRLEEAVKTRDDYASNVSSSAVAGGDVASAFSTAKSQKGEAASNAKDLQGQLDDLDSSIADAGTDRQALLDKLAQARETQSEAGGSLTAAQGADSDPDGRAAALDSSIADAATDRAQLVERLSQQQSRKDSATSIAEQVAAQNQIVSLERQLRELDQKAAKYSAERADLPATLAAEREKKLRDAGVAQRSADGEVTSLERQLREFDQKAARYGEDRAKTAAELDAATKTAQSSPVAILVKNLKTQVQKVRDFRTLLGQLKSKGLDDTTYAQLVGAGVDQGLETAQALAADGTGAVGEIATLQTQLGTAADQLGMTTSRQLYQAGVDSATAYRNSLQGQVDAVSGAMGVVEQAVAASIGRLGVNTSGLMRSAGRDIAEGLRVGLKDKQKALDKTLDSIGGSMEATIRKKLKTHSPSEVFFGVGSDTAEGARLGLVSGMDGIRRAVSGLIPVDSFAAPVAVGAAVGGKGWGTPGAGGNSTVVNIQTFNAGGLSAHEVGAALAWETRWPS